VRLRGQVRHFVVIQYPDGKSMVKVEVLPPRWSRAQATSSQNRLETALYFEMAILENLILNRRDRKRGRWYT